MKLNWERLQVYMNDFQLECLKKSIEWLVRLLNMGTDTCGLAWCMYIVPLYEENGDQYECSNSRGIILLRIVGTLYCWVLVKKMQGLNWMFNGGAEMWFQAVYRMHGPEVFCDEGV